MLIFAIILAFFAYRLFFPYGCTERGCEDGISVNVDDTLDVETLVVFVNNQKIIDVCDEERFRPRITENSFSFNPRLIEGNDLIESISLLEIGYRESCEEDIIIERVYEDINLDYNTVYPNGPRCPGKCYTASINLS